MRELKIKKAYSTSYPCPSQFFIGREEQLGAYSDEVPAPKLEGIPPQPTNIAFIGEWGIGKTSILHYIRDTSKDGEYLKINLVHDFRAIDELLSLTLKNVVSSVSVIERFKDIAKELKEAGISPVGIPSRREDRFTLRDQLVKTWGILERGGIKHCSILIDDINRLGEDDLITLRDIFQQIPSEGCNYSLVVTSTHGTFITPPTEPVARFFEIKQHILPFTKKEIEKSLRKPIEILDIDLDFDKGYIEVLERWSFGYPFFVKFITGKLAIRYKELRAEHLDEHRRKILEALGKAKFSADFSRAPGEAGEKILMMMAEMGAREFKAVEFKNVKHYTTYLDHLQEKGLVNRKERGTYTVYHPLFLEWIKEFVLRHGKKKLEKRD